MKNKSELIKRFVELRAMGETFDKIVTKTKVSKPTLIKWSKLYEDKISYIERALAESTAAEIVKQNKQFIISFAEFLTRSAKQKQTDEIAYNKFNRRALKRIYAMFKKKLQSIEIEVWQTGDIKKIKINMEKSGRE